MEILYKDKNGTYRNTYTGQVIQLSSFPTASSTELNKIYQYTGTTTSTYKNGYFYKCISDGQTTPTYSWVEVKMPADGTWRGTQAEYDLVKNDIPNDTFIIITDRTGTNPVATSNFRYTFIGTKTLSTTNVQNIDMSNDPITNYDLIVFCIFQIRTVASFHVPTDQLLSDDAGGYDMYYFVNSAQRNCVVRYDSPNLQISSENGNTTFPIKVRIYGIKL